MQHTTQETNARREADAIMTEVLGPLAKNSRVQVYLKPDQLLEKVPGGFLVVRAPKDHTPGPVFVALQRGEMLRPAYRNGFLVGFVLQPPGAPSLQTKAVAARLGKTEEWIAKLSRRGPLDRHPGITAYVPAPDGVGFVPKSYKEEKNKKGAKTSPYVLYYERDVRELENDLKQSEEVAGQRKAELLEIYNHIPGTLRTFLGDIAREELLKSGEKKHIIRTNVQKIAVERTKKMSTEERLSVIGRKKPFTLNTSDYSIIQAIALFEQWPENPHGSHGKRPYRPARHTIDEEIILSKRKLQQQQKDGQA